MKSKVQGPSKLQEFMAKQLLASPLSQKEIAEIVGFKNQNVITMIKQGDLKLALDRVPAMARALNCDPKHLFRLALEQSWSEDTMRDIGEVLDTGLSANERKLLEIYRATTNNQDPEITPELQERLEAALAG